MIADAANASPASLWWLPLAAYFVGSLPFGFLAGKLRGIDIRDHGSGNIGATNVLRVLGKGLGIPVFVLDVFKGLVPSFVAGWLSDGDSLLQIATGFAAIIGHNYTCWLGFKGGKGIATSAGALAPIIPIPLLIALAAWLLLFSTTRYVSVASIGAAASIPISAVLESFVQNEWDVPVLSFSLLLAILAIWRHRGNIRKLREGTENRFQRKSKDPSPETGTEAGTEADA